MLEITPYSNASSRATTQVREALRAAPGPGPKPAQREQTAGDRVELSAAARDFDARRTGEGHLDERIRGLRAQIASGTYLTPDKIDYVVDRLHEELFGR